MASNEGVGRELKPTKFDVNKFRRSEINQVSNETTPDQFGQSYNADYDRSKWGETAPAESRRAHSRSDVDLSPRSLHHTLGLKRSQASPGNHTHNGITSKRIIQGNTELFQLSSATSATLGVTFEDPYPNGVIPWVMSNIAIGSGTIARWGSRAIDITNTGFTLFVFRGDATDPAVTLSDVPVQWIATS